MNINAPTAMISSDVRGDLPASATAAIARAATQGSASAAKTFVTMPAASGPARRPNSSPTSRPFRPVVSTITAPPYTARDTKFVQTCGSPEKCSAEISRKSTGATNQTPTRAAASREHKTTNTLQSRSPGRSCSCRAKNHVEPAMSHPELDDGNLRATQRSGRSSGTDEPATTIAARLNTMRCPRSRSVVPVRLSLADIRGA